MSYIANKSAANKPASSPPVPALTSIITFLMSSLSLGNKANWIFLSRLVISSLSALISLTAILLISLSESLSSNISLRSDNSLSNRYFFLANSVMCFISDNSFESSANSKGFNSEELTSNFSIVSSL